LEVLVVVVVKFNVVGSSASPIEETQIDKPSILIGATEAADSEDAFNQLPANDSIKVQSRAEIEYIDGESSALECLLDPVDEIAIEVFIRNDLHIRDVLGCALGKRKSVVRIGRTRTAIVPSTTSVRRRTISVSLVTVPITSRRRRRRAVWPVTISFTVTSVTPISAVSSAAIAPATGRVAIVASSAVVRRTRASARVDRTHIGSRVLLWVSIALGFADFQVCDRESV
jgi:hypothetical protein